ncbi:MAG: c-type cytochrome domain-containing protein [Bryobacteraceae bacterium]
MRGWAGLLFLLSAGVLKGQAGADFARDVEPILARRCVACHNASLSNNGLRLDDPQAMLAGGYSGPVIVPGKPDDSKLIQRVSSTKKGFMMPPVGPPLTPAEVAVLRSWIEAGARVPTRTDKAPEPAGGGRHTGCGGRAEALVVAADPAAGAARRRSPVLGEKPD